MASLRTFLKQTPVPALLVCGYAEDEDKRVKLGESRSKFRDAELSCKGAIRVEALDADGNTLRVWESDEAPAEQAAAVVKHTTPANEQLNMLTAIARLLTEASDAAATRHAEAYRLAYEQQALLVNVMSTRLVQLENAWQQSLMVRAEELEEDAAAQPEPPATDPNTQMITTLLQGAVMSQMANAANGGGNKS
jgi:hypothetical protein